MLKLILVSGWATPQSALMRFSRELSKSFEVIPLNIDELSQNSANTQETSLLSPYASNLFQIIDQTKDRCLLMGWSMGGIISLEMACHSSEKILGLILVSTSPSFCSREEFPHGFPQANVRALSAAIRKDPQSALIRFYRKVCHPFPTTEEREENWLKEVLKSDSFHLHKELDYLMNTDLRRKIHGLHIPSIVIHGRQDVIIPWQAGDWLAQNLPHATFELSEADGHDLPMRKPSWLINKIDFFKTKDSITLNHRPAYGNQ